MKKNVLNKPRLESLFVSAAEMLRKREMKKAYELIIEAMSLAPSAPEPHNLLGIMFDINENEDGARRHFRAAIALEPSYVPAAKNLEQLCRVFRLVEKTAYDYGEMNQNSDDKIYAKDTASKKGNEVCTSL